MSKKHRRVQQQPHVIPAVTPEKIAEDVAKTATAPSSDKVSKLKADTLTALRDIKGEDSPELQHLVEMHGEFVACAVDEKKSRGTPPALLPGPTQAVMAGRTNVTTANMNGGSATTANSTQTGDPKWRYLVAEAILPIRKIAKFITMFPKGSSYRSTLIPGLESTSHVYVFKDYRDAFDFKYENPELLTDDDIPF